MLARWCRLDGKAHSTAMLNEQIGPDFKVYRSLRSVADNNESAKIAQHKISFRRMTTDWHELVTDLDLVDKRHAECIPYEVAKQRLRMAESVLQKPLSISPNDRGSWLSLPLGVISQLRRLQQYAQPGDHTMSRELVQSRRSGDIMLFIGR